MSFVKECEDDSFLLYKFNLTIILIAIVISVTYYQHIMSSSPAFYLGKENIEPLEFLPCEQMSLLSCWGYLKPNNNIFLLTLDDNYVKYLENCKQCYSGYFMDISEYHNEIAGKCEPCCGAPCCVGQ